jgi:hypothetical protein
MGMAQKVAHLSGGLDFARITHRSYPDAVWTYVMIFCHNMRRFGLYCAIQSKRPAIDRNPSRSSQVAYHRLLKLQIHQEPAIIGVEVP